jgi:hypothetical protein
MVSGLIEPEDKQNVKAAVELIYYLHDITYQALDCQRASIPDVISDARPLLQHQQTKPITGAIRNLQAKQSVAELFVYCHMAACYISAFIDRKLDLSARMTRLATAAYLSFLVFSLMGSKVMSHELYRDMQSSVQAAFFLLWMYKDMVLKRQADESLEFCLYLMGDDLLEKVFSVVRTLVHDRNCSSLQLRERLEKNIAIQDIFARHEEWQRKDRRLDGLEKLNRSTVTGDHLVKACSLNLPLFYHSIHYHHQC